MQVHLRLAKFVNTISVQLCYRKLMAECMDGCLARSCPTDKVIYLFKAKVIEN